MFLKHQPINVYFSGVFFWTIVFRFKPAYEMSAFIEVTSFKNLFLVKFQASASVESHHLIIKRSCKTACKHLDAMSARYAVVFAVNIAVEKKVIVAAIMIALFILTCYRCTPMATHVQSKPSSSFALRHRLPEQTFNKTCAYIWRGSCYHLIFERPIDVCSW